MPNQGEAVLTLVDGSPESTRAARFASAIARRAGARLVVLVPAVSRPGPPPPGDRDATETGRSERQAALEEAERRVRALEPDLRGVPSVELRAPELETSFADAVLRVTEQEPCLTVVLPRRGPRLLARMLGDDTSRLLKRSRVAVTLVP